MCIAIFMCAAFLFLWTHCLAILVVFNLFFLLGGGWVGSVVGFGVGGFVVWALVGAGRVGEQWQGGGTLLCKPVFYARRACSMRVHMCDSRPCRAAVTLRGVWAAVSPTAEAPALARLVLQAQEHMAPAQAAPALSLASVSSCTDAFDNDLMHMTLTHIVEGKTVEVPTYDFVTHSRYSAHAWCMALHKLSRPLVRNHLHVVTGLGKPPPLLALPQSCHRAAPAAVSCQTLFP